MRRLVHACGVSSVNVRPDSSKPDHGAHCPSRVLFSHDMSLQVPRRGFDDSANNASSVTRFYSRLNIASMDSTRPSVLS